jgi:hypothetical protein
MLQLRNAMLRARLLICETCKRERVCGARLGIAGVWKHRWAASRKADREASRTPRSIATAAPQTYPEGRKHAEKCVVAATIRACRATGSAKGLKCDSGRMLKTAMEPTGAKATARPRQERTHQHG